MRFKAPYRVLLKGEDPCIGLTIHPHPTLSETIGMAAEAFEGSIPDLYLPKKKKKKKT
jgi:hypothetical protein